MSLGHCKDCVYCKRMTFTPYKGAKEYLMPEGRCIRHAPVRNKDGDACFPIVRVEPKKDGDMTECGDFEPAPKEELRKLRAKYRNQYIEFNPPFGPTEVKQCQS